MISAVKTPSQYTVAELKSILRFYNLITTGVKVELIKRLNEMDANVFTNGSARSITSRGSPVQTTEGQGVEDSGLVNNDVIPDSVRRELELLRREKGAATGHARKRTPFEFTVICW
ncbi:hypothetical protein KPH14_012209 [Odynerus spinipes]|uniref:SAP domain-containing protein n=1 Tax=Odynerus spinipes TaxID=1348599 RepID=A0AAD9RF12_9HYME|nr:hypothetical protein KPH14_012209 [Odynerus spinipes]